MKTYLEWRYKTPPPKHEMVEIAAMLPNGIVSIMPARWNGSVWIDMLTRAPVPDTWEVYAWANRYTAIPPIDKP